MARFSTAAKALRGPFKKLVSKLAVPVRRVVIKLRSRFEACRAKGARPPEPGPSPVAGARRVSGNFPRSAKPNEVLVRRDAQGRVTHYQVYADDGLPLKRVDLVGRAHGGVDTPHVLAFERHTNPATGTVYVQPAGTVRTAFQEELTGLD